MEDLLPWPTVEFVGGPYDKRVVVFRPDANQTIAACSVFRLDPGDPEEGHLYWLRWGRIHTQVFVFEYDKDWT